MASMESMVERVKCAGVRWSRLVALLVCLSSGVEAQLRSIASVRGLTHEQAVEGRKFDIVAQVSKSSLLEGQRRGGGIFIYDGKYGIYGYLSGQNFDAHRDTLKKGDEVRLRGVTQGGFLYPGLSIEKITILGHGTLPEPQRVDIGNILDPELDCAWVEFDAVVLETRETRRYGQVIARVVSDDLLLNVVVPDTDRARDLLSAYAYRDVRIRAVATSRVDERGRYSGRLFRAASIDDFTVLPIELLPLKSIQDLQNSAAPPLQKARVGGIVLHQEEREIFLRSGGGHLQVVTVDSRPLQRGDRVEVSGRVETKRSGTRMLGASVEFIASGEAPPAELLEDLAAINSFDLVGALVSIRGSVRAISGNAGGQVLECESLGVRFNVLLGGELPDWGDIAVGGEIEATGIALASRLADDGRDSGEPAVILIKARDAGDVTVLARAPFWTRQRILMGTQLLLALAIAALLWAVMLRAKVREQTQLIAEKIETEATFDERQRIARELHDTFQQDMTGISLQLSLLDDDLRTGNLDQAGRSAELATKMLNHCREEAKETINDLRIFGSLPALVEGLFDEKLRPRAEAIGVRLTLQTTGKVEPLPPRCEHHVLRIITEAVANALQHAQAQEIIVSLEYLPSRFRATISDDGKGFDPAESIPKEHFGIIGIRERINRMRAKGDINSALDDGTTVTVEIDCDDR